MKKALITFTIVILGSFTSAVSAEWFFDESIDSIGYRVFMNGHGPDAVADSAWVTGSVKWFRGNANIPSSITFEYFWYEPCETCDGGLVKRTRNLQPGI